MMFLLVSMVLLLTVPGCYGLWTVSRLTVRSGGSVTIPCHYKNMFRGQAKYWCKGKIWHTCITVRDSTRINITDNPTELVTTLTLSGLQVKDTGRYWCALKRGGLLKANIRTSLELQVTADTPDLWVSSSSVFGTEGRNVTVECCYRDQLQEDEKKWCRSGDLHSCQSQQDMQSSQQGKLHFKDNGQGVFTVILTNLQTDDGGWYWCMAGGTQAPVHLTVTAASTTINTELPETSSVDKPTTPTALLDKPTTPTTSAALTSTNSTHIPVISTLTPLTSTHTPLLSTHSTHTSLHSTHSTRTILISTHSPFSLFTSSATAHSPNRTSTTWPNSTLTALTKDPSAAPKVTSVPFIDTVGRVYMWLLGTMGILLTAAIVATVFWRRQTLHRENHMLLEEVEQAEISVKDDVVLLDHEWTSRTVLKLQEEPNSAALF